MDSPIIIIGAGAAGLMAARELSGAGFPVTLLEADPRPGGRIHTLHGEGFTGPVEAGAEFVHGQLPLTMELLKEAGISCQPVKGRRVRVQKGEWETREGGVDGNWEELMRRMKGLTRDLPVAEFLSSHFPGEKYAGLRNSVKGFAEGYDLANIQTASTLALFREWKGEDHGSYRVKGGYGCLIDFLVTQCRANGCRIHFAAPVKRVEWEKNRVQVFTAGGESFGGNKLITTVSLGVLHEASIQFSPGIPAHFQAARQLGYGSVIKILVQFKTPFWNKQHKNIGFIQSDEPVPTWWAGSPDNQGLLTGWLTGERMKALRGLDEGSLIHRCLASLSSIFAVDEATIKDQLVTALVRDWAAEPFVLGGYSFDTVESASARKIINQPLEDTLFFAGEALYEGNAPGTVEAALTSGRDKGNEIVELITHFHNR
jgi:monoamine oxidase